MVWSHLFPFRLQSERANFLFWLSKRNRRQLGVENLIKVQPLFRRLGLGRSFSFPQWNMYHYKQTQKFRVLFPFQFSCILLVCLSRVISRNNNYNTYHWTASPIPLPLAFTIHRTPIQHQHSVSLGVSQFHSLQISFSNQQPAMVLVPFAQQKGNKMLILIHYKL